MLNHSCAPETNTTLNVPHFKKERKKEMKKSKKQARYQNQIFRGRRLACYASFIYFIHMVVLASKTLPKNKIKTVHFPLISDKAIFTVIKTSLV